jgi:hypothetical protein
MKLSMLVRSSRSRYSGHLQCPLEMTSTWIILVVGTPHTLEKNAGMVVFITFPLPLHG